MSAPLLDVVSRLFPPREGVDAVRHRFVAVAVVMGVAVSLVTAPLFFGINPSLTWVVVAFGGAVAGLGVLLRVLRRPAVAFWLLQGLAGLLFLASEWSEDTLQGTWGMWLAILPLTAVLYGGARAGAVGLLLAAAFLAVMLLAPNPELYPRYPVHPGSLAIRIASFLLSSFALAAAWHRLREEALAQARAAARARSLFLANMSHELRTPMNGVLGFTDLLLASEPRSDQRELLEVMRRSGEHLLALINDVIDFTRLDSLRLPLVQGTVNLAQVAADVVRQALPVAEEKALTLSTHLDPALPAAIAGDELRVRQVLINLVGNAVKFTAQGSVQLRLMRQGDRLRAEVTDTGPGIAPEVHARLFQPFEQAEVDTNRRFGGSGLGLAISRRLVEAMGGTLTLDSAPGRGSTFIALLPLEPAPKGAPAPAPPAVERPLTPLHARVLVVDDNAVNLRVASALLQKLGCTSTTVQGGDQALDALAVAPFDVVLMDCYMPGVDGLEATRRIRALESDKRHTPVVALTASALPEELARCREAGMNDCLTKPVLLRPLRETLERVLQGTQGTPPTR